MSRCASCGAALAAGKKFCGDCGAAVEAASLPTATSFDEATSGGRPRAPRSLPTPDPASGQRFLPGTVLAGRYRIVGLLGRGGMGEVYRADDLKLGQAVALKLLPGNVERDPARLERFLNEVRLALRVTHPAVCRVFDIGEVDDHHFLSMEYVDGEDLSSLLRRIGRLPRDKAIEIARQLCAGLAAAHDQGILHRDLKPANVMIDGRGRAKITDFGLAGATRGIEGVEARAGTPGYMAPEQMAGKELTVRTDVYALGLVLYELFTGKRAFEAQNAVELARRQLSSAPTSPSSHVEGFDPVVEHVILRCLDPDPARRPDSALAVAAALPGGDPLAAALAAGETPSPEMVAEAGGKGSLQPAVAGGLLAAILVGLLAVWVARDRALVYRQIPLSTPPEELALTARGVAAAAGYSEPPVDRAWGFWRDNDYFTAVERNDDSPDRWDDLGSTRPVPLGFWYRQSPRYMVPANYVGWISPGDPPSVASGLIDVRLDPQGRLLRFQAVPPERDESEGPWPEPDWSTLFELAAYEPVDFEAVEPTWIPLVGSDLRRAWKRGAAGNEEGELRIEAAAFRGRPVYFEVIPDWRIPRRMDPPPITTGERLGGILGATIVISVLTGGALLARRNLRLGRGDRRGALRLSTALFAAGLVYRLLRIDHVPAIDEMPMFFWALSVSLGFAAVTWLFYMAVEPYVRRLWPDTLIAWSRLLDGRLRDPLIGRHVLYGATAGLGISLWFHLGTLAPRWLGLASSAPFTGSFASLEGLRDAIAQYIDVVTSGFFVPIAMLLAILLLRVLLRRQALAIAAFLLVFTTLNAFGADHPLLDAGVALGFWCIALTLLIRFGLFTVLVAVLFSSWNNFAMTVDPSSWYFGRSLLTLLVFAALAGYGFYIALAGRQIFKDMLHD